MNHQEALIWLSEASKYFMAAAKDANEDRAHAASFANAESAKSIAELVFSDTWRPLHSLDLKAFKPGTSVILYVPGHGECRAGVVGQDDLVLVDWNSRRPITKATHWKPLSTPPAAVKESLTACYRSRRSDHLAHTMFHRTIEKYSTVEDFAEALVNRPEAAFSFLSNAATDCLDLSARRFE